MRQKGVARRYARAVSESIKSDRELETLCGEMTSFAVAYREHAELRKMLINPAVPHGVKLKIAEKTSAALGLSAKCSEIIALLLRKGRIDVAPEVAEILTETADEKLKKVHVKVLSAYALSADEIKSIQRTFSDLTGRRAEIEAGVDRSLIGGIVARVGSRVYDGSIANQLRQMKLKLIQEA